MKTVTLTVIDARGFEPGMTVTVAVPGHRNWRVLCVQGAEITLGWRWWWPLEDWLCWRVYWPVRRVVERVWDWLRSRRV